MDIALINRQTNICENIVVFDTVQLASEIANPFEIFELVVAQIGYWIGDCYLDGNWVKKEICPEELKEKYEGLTVKYIREMYTITDESKITREYLAYPDDETKKEAFSMYNEYVESCKVKAHQEVYGN